MKRGLFVLLFLICIGSVSSIEINLTKDVYSNDVNFQGNVIIDESNVDVTKIVSGDVRECGSYVEREIELYDLLIGAGFDLGPKEIFVEGDSTSAYQVILGDNQSASIGLLINGDLNQLNFSVSGSGEGFYIDVGADGQDDWHYVGDRIGWSGIIDAEEYDGSYDLTNIYEVDPHDQRCSEIIVDFDERVGELLVKIEVSAKGGEVDDQLVARIGGKSCTLLEGQGDNEWGLVSCEISLDSSRYDSPNNFDVCIWSASNSYRVPSRVGTDFYFTRLRIAEYNEVLGSEIYVSDSKLISEVNGYYNDCNEDWCLIPMRLRLETAGEVNLNSLFARSLAGAEFNVFHEVTSETIEVNLTGKSISLGAFLDLTTPDVEEDVCILRMGFEGEYDEASFDVSAGPTPIIEVSSRYMAKGFPVDFDASKSEARNNRNIVSWNWDFGDGFSESGEKVSHTYNTYGNYSVTLSVKDSLGAEANTSLAVHVIMLEEHLNNEFQGLDILFSEAKLNAIALKEEVSGFYAFMGYSRIINISETAAYDLEMNFTAVKNSAATDKDTQYAFIANDLHSMLKITPINLIKSGSKNIRNLLLTGSGDVFDYSADGKYSPAYADAIYDFNRDNVEVDMDSTLIEVEFLDGSANYLYVRKSIDINGGSNKVIIEDLREAVNNLDEVTGGSKGDNSNIIYWNVLSNPEEIEYVVKTDNFETINTIVYSDVDVTGEEMYCFDDPSCGKYCGDGSCTIADYLGVDESDELNNNYCPGDCVLNNSMTKYIILFVIFFIFIIYLLLYKGPGSIKYIINGVSGKKVFITDRDRITLKNFVDLSLKRGFNQLQIREALIKKGWNKHQIDEVMSNQVKK